LAGSDPRIFVPNVLALLSVYGVVWWKRRARALQTAG
jgi:hypothetical protein